MAGAGVHGGAEGVEGRSDTVTGWRDTLCEAAKRLQGCARAARVGETTLMWSTISCLVVLPLLPQACARVGDPPTREVTPCSAICYTGSGKLRADIYGCAGCLPPAEGRPAAEELAADEELAAAAEPS